MKFDSKDLMNAMGLCVGDKFIVKDNDAFEGIWEVVHEKVYHDQIMCKGEGCTYQLEQFIDEEIDLFPRYKMTEDEKAIVRSVNRYIGVIGRYKNSEALYVSKENEENSKELPIYDGLFAFIKPGKYVSLEELKRCL